MVTFRDVVTFFDAVTFLVFVTFRVDVTIYILVTFLVGLPKGDSFLAMRHNYLVTVFAVVTYCFVVRFLDDETFLVDLPKDKLETNLCAN